MERESFEDNEIAEILNTHFISIKVDREERPDVDSVYMNVCQALTGQGGWPLSIFMTAEQKPFFAGTYFPKTDKMGMYGMKTLLNRIITLWHENKDALIKSSNEIFNSIKSEEPSPIDKTEGPSPINMAYHQFCSDFDKRYGGFGAAPKFPSPHNLLFLLRYWYVNKDSDALSMVGKTLDSMYKGGIYDHIGYGFSRYSTDKKWLVPHFEKMLYDNALLSMAYLETYHITKNQFYAQAAEEIFTYILRDMVSPEGAFYSAEDADSEGEEGKFYVWTYDEILEVLGEKDGKKFCEFFNITPKGNFEEKNIPNLIDKGTVLQDSQNADLIAKCKQQLFKVREKRIHPHKDDKILTGWNGLMIAALAIGGKVLNNKKYIKAAKKAVSFIFNSLVNENGRLLARYRDNHAAYYAYLDDYAYLTWGLLELYEATYDTTYLQKALSLNDELINNFLDKENGGFFLYSNDSEQLITRPKELYDGATPSGNSVTAYNMIRLARFTGKHEYEEFAQGIFEFFSTKVEAYPKGFAFTLLAMMLHQRKSEEIIIVTDATSEDTQSMLDIVAKDFRPFTTSLLYITGEEGIEQLVPALSSYNTIQGKPTAYVCKNFTCKAPITDLTQFKTNLFNDN